MRADLDLIQRAEVFLLAVMLALRNRTFDAVVCSFMKFHDFVLLRFIRKSRKRLLAEIVCADFHGLFTRNAEILFLQTKTATETDR